jgi:hypothetical protein
MLKIVSTTDKPLSHADLHHVGPAHDVMGLSYGDLACWVTPDRQVLVHYRGLDQPPEDAVCIVVDVATAVRLALRLGELSAGIVADLSKQLGEARHD